MLIKIAFYKLSLKLRDACSPAAQESVGSGRAERNNHRRAFARRKMAIRLGIVLRQAACRAARPYRPS